MYGVLFSRTHAQSMIEASDQSINENLPKTESTNSNNFDTPSPEVTREVRNACSWVPPLAELTRSPRVWSDPPIKGGYLKRPSSDRRGTILLMVVASEVSN